MNYGYNRERYLLLDGIDNDLLVQMSLLNTVIAGGAITSIFCGRKIKDYDLYFPTKEAALEMIDHMKNAKYKSKNAYALLFESENSYTFKSHIDKNVYQVVLCMFYDPDDPASVYRDFDFTACMGAYQITSNRFFFHPTFFVHNGQLRIIFSPRCPYPINALYRVKKYIDKGYRINGTELVKIALSIHALKIETYADLKRHLMGIDTLILKDLLVYLDDRKDEKFDAEQFIENLGDYIDGYYRGKMFVDSPENEDNKDETEEE